MGISWIAQLRLLEKLGELADEVAVARSREAPVTL